MAVGDAYELTDVGTMYGQQCTNVFTFVQNTPWSGPGLPSEALALWYEGNLINNILQMQTPDYLHTGIKVRNLFDAADTYEAGISVPGNILGETNGAPAYSAAGLTLLTDNGAVSDGAKRIGGLPNASTTDGVITNSTVIARLNALADVIASPVMIGTPVPVSVFDPVVIKRVRSGSPGAYTYRLPETIEELVFGIIIDVIWDVIMTTQNSRKIGVGN